MGALIIGASGATGLDLLDALIADPTYTEVVAFVRRPIGKSHAKMSEVITDFDHLENVVNEIRGDVWFSCLGTTLKIAGSKEAQWQIDYEMPLRFAEIARNNGVQTTVLLSAHGASANSRIFYSKMKGELEQAIENLNFDCTIIFRPGILIRKDSDRMAEKMTIGVVGFLNKLGLFKKYRPMPTTLLSSQMARSPKAFNNGKHIIDLQEIFAFQQVCT